MLSENGRALARSVRVEHKVEHKKYKKILKYLYLLETFNVMWY